MRGARGNSRGTQRTWAGISCDPMRRTRKAIGRPTWADGIDTVTGTMPRRPLPSPCSDRRRAKRRGLSATQRRLFLSWSVNAEALGTDNARPPITADNYRRRVYRTRCGLVRPELWAACLSQRQQCSWPSCRRRPKRVGSRLLPRKRPPGPAEARLLVSAILRNKTMDWVRRGPSDSSWGDIMPLRWGGIFYESRVPGGRLCRKLSTRLAGLITLCVEASGAVAFLRAGVTGLFRGSAMMAKMVQFGLSSKRPRHVQQVAQAYLDDLAANRCVGKQSLPLERLSEVARRNGSAEVNITLVELFSQEGTGTLIVLDPRFHPGMDPVTIRVVPPKSQDDAATYDLVHGGVRAVRESAASEDAEADATPASTWERSDMGKKEWLGLFKSLAKRKERLEAPPRENSRDRESYIGLRDLVLADASVRRAFLAVHWKGRPSGLALLGQLLSAGTLVPEFDTDADYLEAELEHLGQDHVYLVPIEDTRQHGLAEGALEDGPGRVGPDASRRDDEVEEVECGRTRGFTDGRHERESTPPGQELVDQVERRLPV